MQLSNTYFLTCTKQCYQIDKQNKHPSWRGTQSVTSFSLQMRNCNARDLWQEGENASIEEWKPGEAAATSFSSFISTSSPPLLRRCSDPPPTTQSRDPHPRQETKQKREEELWVRERDIRIRRCDSQFSQLFLGLCDDAILRPANNATTCVEWRICCGIFFLSLCTISYRKLPCAI